ncbi:hypothetical protein [Paracoccus sp. (in: a-proteobacteria)]|uniref:hypothetical protein n=1 Tax=Paracoccus sp. TaxID=267 RepID=UPI0028AED3DC|nr:hypothetical protein [Paracoccus sp. (in: a-proteobacteria)]
MIPQSAVADLSMRFNAFLDRFSPPRQIASNPKALQDDANALLRIVLDHAPTEGWQDWFPQAIRHLESGMTTRSWPAPGEVVRACRGALAKMPATETAANSRGEANAIQMLIDWHAKFGSQMPGLGRPDRTAELIRRGVLRDEREARFKGFVLSPETAQRVKEQPSGRAEWDHHVAVMARLDGRPRDEMDFDLQDDARRNAPRTFRHAGDVFSTAAE